MTISSFMQKVQEMLTIERMEDLNKIIQIEKENRRLIKRIKYLEKKNKKKRLFSPVSLAKLP